MLCLPGSGRFGKLSQVLRPITTGLPMVVALKRLMSVESRHGISPSRPMTPFAATATTILTSTTSHRDRRADGGIGDVAVEPEILEAEGEDVLDLGVDPHPRQRLGRALQLLPRLPEMVGVEVRIAQRVNEVARLQARH